MEKPSLSVVVPARGGARTLDLVLRAILASEIPRHQYELIVVNDSRDEEIALIAARHADTVVRLGGSWSGSAYARNRGAEVASADVIAFVDPDSLVRPDTLSRMLEFLRANPTFKAVTAIQDSHPSASNFFSVYWNLLVHYGDRQGSRMEANFGSGCSMIRSSALRASGMYDEWKFGSGSLEGLELGHRLQRLGHDVYRDSQIAYTELRRWDAVGVARHVWNRSVLLSRSLGYRATRTVSPSEVIVTLSDALIPLLTLASVTALSGAFLPRVEWLLAVFAVVAMIVLTNFRVVRFYAQQRGLFFAAAIVPVHVVYQAIGGIGLCAGWLMGDVIGDRLPDAATQAYSELGLEVWPPVPRAR